MTDHNTIVSVRNRSAGTLSYRIPEENIRRSFQPNELKNIPYSELEKLTFQPGGTELIAEFMQASSQEVVENLNIFPEQEYWLSNEQIKDLVLTGTQDAFLDCLDFAPEGVIDILKKLSVELPISDLNKVRALKDKTGFDAASAVRHMEEERTPEAPEVAKERRVGEQTEVTEGRRSNPTYKVVSKT